MIRTQSRPVAGIRVGLLVALYLFTLLMPTSVSAADAPADPAGPAASVEPASTPEATSANTTESITAPLPLQAPEVIQGSGGGEPSPAIETPSPPNETPAPAPPPASSPDQGPASSGASPRQELATAEPAASPMAAAAVPDGPAGSTAVESPTVASPSVRYIVTFAQGSTGLQRAVALSSVDATTVSIVSALGLAVVDIPVTRVAAGDVAMLAADPTVKGVELDQVRDIEAEPGDPRSADQWSLPRIDWDTVHDQGLPEGSVTVAILDTGVDARHPDLTGRLLPGTSFVDGSAPDTDPNGHGTWMAGIVAAATDNGTGIAGIGGEGVRVLPVTVLDAAGTGQDSAVIAGLIEAVDRGAGVILMAFSNPGYSPALQAAIDYARAHDAVVIAANGNDGTTSPTYPAGDRGVMGIASTDRDDRLAADSNHGPQTFLAAPGVDILTTAAAAGGDHVGDDYRSVSGTSAAAAEVAGAVAVLRALDPGASNAVVIGRVARSAAAIGTRDETGNGRLDLARAMADRGTSRVEPSGIAGATSGGPFVGPYVAAASRVWTGLGADNNWTTPLNWGGVAPVAGDDLVFPSGASRPTNTNNYPAATSFNSITILGSGYTLSGNSIALGTAGLTETGVTATNTISLAISVAATATIAVNDAASSLTLGGVISGAGGLTSTGAGTLILSGANTYIGVTTVSAGTTVARTATALGTVAGATSVATGATLTVDGSGLAVAEPVTLNGAGTSSTGALRNLANNNTWSGAITLGSASTIVSTAGTFTVSAAIATTGFVLTIDGAGNLTKSAAAISGTGGVTQTAAGTVTLTFVNTYTGATTVNAGTLKVGIANAVPAASALTVAGAATFDLNGFGDTVGSLAGAGTVTSGGVAAVTLTNGGNNTSTSFSGTIAAGSGTLALTKLGSGTLTLSGTNAYTGVTTVTAGVIRVQSNAALGATSAGATVASAAAIEVDGTGLVIGEPVTSLAGTGIAAAGAIRNLANDNTWSAAITLGATPRINSDGGTLTLAGNISGAAQALTIGGAGSTTVGGVIGTTTGTLTKDGAGTLTLSTAATYTGVTTISVGTLKLGVANGIGASSSLTVAAGATFDLAGFSDTIGSLAGAGSVTSSVASAVILTTGGNNGSTAFSGVASDGSGALALTKNGTGTLTLSGVNTYTGTTTINAGTVSIAVDSNLGAAPGAPTPGRLTFAGGTLLVSANLTIDANRGIALTGAGTISTTVAVTYGGIVAGPGTLTKVGTGTLTLAGVNTYTGATSINGGTVAIAADSALGSAPGAPTAGQLVFNTGTLLVTANLTLDPNRGVALTGAGGISTTFAVTYGGIIAGAGAFTKTGTGTLTLSGANTYTGATFLSAGTIAIAADSAFGAAPGAPTAGKLTFNTGTLLASADLTIDPNRGIALTGAGTISTNAGVTVTYAGIVAGASTLTKLGTGTLILSGANTFAGVTTLTAGVLRLRSNAALGTVAGGTTVASGSAIEIDGLGLAIAEPITSIIGTGVAGAGAIRNLVNDNTLSGAITLGAGGATLVSDADTLTLSGGIGGATRPLTIGGTGNITVSGAIAVTTGSVTKSGAGTLTLAAVNTYTGATTINTGTVKLAIANSIGASSALTVAAGATFDLNGFSDTIGSLAGAGSVTSGAPGAVTLTSGGNNTSTTFSGVVSDGSGALSLTKLGTLILTLSGINTYSGVTTIGGGTVSIAADSGLGSAPGSATPGALIFNSGILATTATFTLNANRGIALTGAGTISPTLTLTYNGVIAGAGALTKAGAGTLILGGVNTYGGAMTISAGTLSIASDSGLGTAPASPTPGSVTFSAASTLLTTASFTLDSNRGIALTGPATISSNPGTTVTFGGIVAGASTLTKAGTGTLVLSGANTYAGLTTVSAGVLRVQSSAALGTTAGATSVTSGAAIEVDGSALVVAEPITTLNGTGIAAAGALRNLANDNTWSGNVVLGAASRINSDGGTLSLSGTVTGATFGLTVGGSGNTTIGGVIGTTTGTLTKDGAGTLLLSAANTYTGATTISVGTLALGIANAVGASSALTVAAGATFDLNGLNDTIGSLAGAGSVTSSAAGAPTLTSGGNNTSTTFSGVASDGSGTLSLTKAGTGTLTLSGVNTYGGTTSINAGSVSVAADSGLGAAPGSASPGDVTFNGGALVLSASFTINANRGIALAGAGTISTNAGVSATYGGVVAGAGAFTKTGTGTLTLSGVSTYTGVTSITAGILAITSDAALGTPPASPTPGQIVFNAGTLQTTASFLLDADRGISLTGAGSISVNPGTTLTYGGIVAGPGALTKLGTGTLVLAGVNTYSGATTISAGAVAISGDAALGAAPGAPTAGKLTFNSGTLQTSASFTLDPNRGIALTAAGTISTDPGTTLVYGGIVAGPSTLTKAGTGTLTLAGVNTYAGLTTVAAGTLAIAADSSLGTVPAATTANQLTFTGGTLLATGSFTLATKRGITLTAPGTISTDPGVTLSYAGVIAGASTLTKTGTGTLTLTGISTYTGATTIGAGTVSIAANSGLGTAPGAATPGQLTFVGGTLQTTASFTLSATRGIALNGSGGTFDVASGTTLVYGGIATGNGDLVKSAAGTLDLGPATVSVGGVTIADGVLVGPTPGTFTVAGDWNNNASSVAFSGGSGTVMLSGGSPQAVGGSFPTTFNSLRIANPSGVTLATDATVGGVLTFTTGTITTGASTIYLAAGGSVARTSGHVVGNFKKYVATGPTSVTFEVGDGGVYAPVTVDFASVTVAGDLTASSAAGDHPAIGTSGLDPSKTANRFWTLANAGIAFSTYDATFTFVAGDLDPGVDPLLLAVDTYTGGTWVTQTTGTRTATSTQATGINAFGDFAVGMLSDTAPVAVDDSYAITQDNTLVVAAAGVLANDSDAEGEALSVATPRPVSGPSHGALTLNADGSFTYTPDLGYSGPDSFTYKATAGALTSSDATVTITVTAAAYVSGSGWLPTFDATRYLALTFPPYVPSGATVTGATFRHSYRSEIAGDTTCYYFEVYDGATLLATHGSPTTPVSCTGLTFTTDTISLPEIDNAVKANDVTVRLYIRNSGGHHSVHRLATLGVDYSLD